MLTADLDFDLPPHLIATRPAPAREDARLMVIHRAADRIEHRHVRDLPELGVFRRGDLMVVNQTQVLPAYLTGTRTATGGKVTGLFVRAASGDAWTVMLESGGKLRPGERIDLHPREGETVGAQLELVEPEGGGHWHAKVTAQIPTDPPLLLGRIGRVPLPPYLRKARRDRGEPIEQPGDAERYETVYARDRSAVRNADGTVGGGSVAAPTAGLHLTPRLLEALDELGVERAAVTLHVGPGTFLPVKTRVLEDHDLHAEWIDVPPEAVMALRRARKGGHRILAVGTTSARTIESLPHPLSAVGFYQGMTSLFITPQTVAEGTAAFRLTDWLLTNFHLPKSTLLAMVAALPGVGVDRLLGWYREAVEREYRFYSFGDAMLIV
jgi:S-adenosylmethionine:tRNA ribosyltransferase-isomerase